MATSLNKIKTNSIKKNVTASKEEAPFMIFHELGIAGMHLTLNVQQLQELSRLYHILQDKDTNDHLTTEEKRLLPFLEIFAQFEVPTKNIWDNFLTDEEMNNMC